MAIFVGVERLTGGDVDGLAVLKWPSLTVKCAVKGNRVRLCCFTFRRVRSGALERVGDALKGITLFVEHAVLVELLGRGDVGVPEDQLHIARLDTCGFEQGRGSVACLVHGDAPEVGLLDDEMERAREVPGLDWLTGAAGEDELLCGSWIGDVDIAGGSEYLDERPELGKERQRASASSGLHVAGDDLAVDALKLLTNLNRTPLEVDVAPAQAEGFAASDAVDQQQVEPDLPLVAADGVKEDACFVEAPGVDLLRLVLREVDEARDVAVDVLFAFGAAEGGAEDAPHLLDGAGACAVGGQRVDHGLDVGNGE